MTADAADRVVAIVGRPNVGKSTLFNRLLGRQAAIVEQVAGVTRDRNEMLAEWLGRRFLLVDTGGWAPRGTTLDEQVSRQSEKAVSSADLVLLVVDASVGVTNEDAEVAAWLRRGASGWSWSRTRPTTIAGSTRCGTSSPLAWAIRTR